NQRPAQPRSGKPSTSFVHPFERLVYFLSLLVSALLASRSVDDEIGVFHFVLERHLPADPVQHLVTAQTVALHRALNLLLWTANHNNQAIIPLVNPRLNQYRSFSDDDGIGRLSLNQCVLASFYVRMHQSVELGEL